MIKIFNDPIITLIIDLIIDAKYIQIVSKDKKIFKITTNETNWN